MLIFFQLHTSNTYFAQVQNNELFKHIKNICNEIRLFIDTLAINLLTQNYQIIYQLFITKLKNSLYKQKTLPDVVSENISPVYVEEHLVFQIVLKQTIFRQFDENIKKNK